ncbi:uncharacterized protein VSU04_009856 [Chlamydotis macqueenii]
MDTCHRWSGAAVAAKTPAGIAGRKRAGGREEGLAAHPGAGRVEDGQRGRGTAWPRQDGERTVRMERREIPSPAGAAFPRATPDGAVPSPAPAATVPPSPAVRRSWGRGCVMRRMQTHHRFGPCRDDRRAPNSLGRGDGARTPRMNPLPPWCFSIPGSVPRRWRRFIHPELRPSKHQ